MLLSNPFDGSLGIACESAGREVRKGGTMAREA
jgi:hypothetical protein